MPSQEPESVADVIAEWGQHARRSGAMTQSAFLARIAAALERERAELRKVAEEMEAEKIELCEVWHNDGLGGSAGTHLVREVANARLEWAARLRAIAGEEK